MYRKFIVLFMLSMALACLAIAMPSFALTFEEVERNIDRRIEQQHQMERQPQLSAGDTPSSRCCSYEETAEDRARRARDAVAARFINPHPELGCMYYDANNVRHWWPGCREL